MAMLAAHGLELDLPQGWHGRIRRREQWEALEGRIAAVGAPAPVIAHASSFGLPPDIGDFGSGAVEVMRGSDVFMALVEFDDDSVGTALFRRTGIPRQLRREAFSPHMLQRTLPGQGGTQVFFTAAGRPFCLYVVLGSFAMRGRAIPAVNALLQGITIR